MTLINGLVSDNAIEEREVTHNQQVIDHILDQGTVSFIKIKEKERWLS